MRPSELPSRLFKVLIRAIFPRQCIGCGNIVDEEEWLCDSCRRRLERIAPDRSCPRCGMPKSDCHCRVSVFHFEAAIAPFYNTTVARKGLYRYKFNKKMHYAEFFAREMALSVKMAFSGVKFDAVCCVPTSRRSLRRYGFDHTALLAERLSEILGLPLLSILTVRGKRKTQHRLRRVKRFLAVRGIYSCSGRADGMRVLLVDDIMTTGATLDECARQLLSAGADEVYCACALLTPFKKKRKRKK